MSHNHAPVMVAEYLYSYLYICPECGGVRWVEKS